MSMTAQTATTAAPAASAFGQVVIYPIIGYRDLEAAIAWLERAFSFTPLLVMRNDDGSYGHVELRLGNGVIMPTTREKGGDAANPWQQEIAPQGHYVALDGLDAHYGRAVAAGAEIVRPLADTGYGSREYTARDLEGNLWAFGTYRPDVG